MDWLEQDIERFSRQILAEGVGGRGQRLWMSSSVQLLGDAHVLSPCASYLGLAGVGRLVAPSALLPHLDRATSPHTTWIPDDAATLDTSSIAITVTAGDDAQLWHRQVYVRPPALGALWIGVRDTQVCLAFWAVQREGNCPLDSAFWSRWAHQPSTARREPQPTPSVQELYDWCAGTLAAGFVLDGLLLPPAQQKHFWIIEDFARGTIEQGPCALTDQRAECRLCSEARR